MGFFDVVNVYGLLFTIILVVPNIVYAKTHNYSLNSIPNRSMLYVERIGKYCSLFLMSINIGILEEGFTSDVMRTFWLVATFVMIALYLVFWILYFKNETKTLAYALTIVPALIFMLSGLLQVKTLLLTFGIIFLIGQLYVTSKLTKNN